MKKFFMHSLQGRIVGILIIFMSIMLVVSIYTTRQLSQSVMLEGKEDKLIGIAAYLEKTLGDRSYDSILADVGASDASREEKIAVLNKALAEMTDEIASIYPGLGVGYYSLDLDAILTYGPSSEYAQNVGVSIGPDHPGRTVMEQNEPVVKMGSMVRGKIMNAMYPIERDGQVIGYTWANELSTDIEKEYFRITGRILGILTVFFLGVICLVTILSRRLIENVDRLVTGIKDMRWDLTKRITNVGGELGEVAESINNMAEHVEKTAKEHEARIVAEAANLAQRDFLARMSHELRTPMNGVLGMTRLAMQAQTKDDSMQYLIKIQSSATLLLGIINDILDFSKIEAGKLEAEGKPFAVKETIDNIRELMMPRVTEKDIAFHITVDGAVPDMIVSDGLKFSQILLNLLGNAIKFTKEGSVSLNVNAMPFEGGMIRIECIIKDTGIGMTNEQLEHLFKPFSQADSSTVREFGGTGLGLSISKAMVELLGGKITVASQAGKGSAFSFYILAQPYEGEEFARPVDTGEKTKQSYEGLKVLLAEDNEINREIAIAVLEDFGMEIDCAENGEEAVKAYEKKEYDLIFMDIRMPVMDGFAATRSIRAIENEQGKNRIPIVAMTANAMQEDRMASRDAGMDGHISKPLELDEIQKELCKVVNKTV